MRERLLNRLEEIIIHVTEKVQKGYDKYQHMQEMQIEKETGINKEFMLFYLKMKALSILPEKWRGEVQKIIF